MFPYGYNMPFNNPYNMTRMGIGSMSRGGMGGLFSKLGGIKSINWQSLLNNASRTLGVINQAIPIVKQVGPMYNNVKSMLKIASLFKDATEPVIKENNKTNINTTDSKENMDNTEKENTIINNNYSNSPSFFI